MPVKEACLEMELSQIFPSKIRNYSDCTDGKDCTDFFSPFLQCRRYRVYIIVFKPEKPKDLSKLCPTEVESQSPISCLQGLCFVRRCCPLEAFWVRFCIFLEEKENNPSPHTLILHLLDCSGPIYYLTVYVYCTFGDCCCVQSLVQPGRCKKKKTKPTWK